MKSLINYLVLPSVQSEFEENYLARMNRVAAWFFACHLPSMVLLAYLNDTGPGMAFVLTSATLAGPLLAMKSLKSPRQTSMVMGVASMLMGGLLVHFGQGPVQIEMHFYFFVLLALLAVFANPMVIVAAAVTAALHHTVLWYFLPASVFNYEAPIWVVAIHAAFVVLESAAACFIARSFFDNVIGLEKIVAARTAQLELRNQDMRMLLDSVEQGFFTVDSDGRMSAERSAAVDQLFGEVGTEAVFADVLRNHDEKAASWVELGLDDVFAEIMPVEVTLDQMPDRCVANGRCLSIEYNPVYTDGNLTGLAVVVSDITAEVEREKLEVENREMMAMIERLSSDKSGLLEFFQEAEGLIDALRNESRDDLDLVKRRVHTLKGNAAIFGLERLSAACHTIEDHIAEHNELPESVCWTELFGCWASTRGNLRRLVSDKPVGITLDDREYDAVLECILANGPRDSLATRVAAWRLEPTSKRIGRIAEQAKTLAARLGKGHINVQQHCSGLKIDPACWAGYWSSFTHVIRNAVDHGLELPEDRLAKGKPETGTLEIGTFVEGEQFVVSLSDDGSGIDWERVGQSARNLGLPAETHDDLMDALCYQGLSTAEAVTDTSGRGVGMGDVRQCCRDLGGDMEIESTLGVGTKFRFVFPIATMAPGTIEQLTSHGIDAPERTVLGADG